MAKHTVSWAEAKIGQLQNPQRLREARKARKEAMCLRGWRSKWVREGNAKATRYEYDEPARARADSLWLARHAR